MSLISKSSKRLRSLLGLPVKLSESLVEPSEECPQINEPPVDASELFLELSELPVELGEFFEGKNKLPVKHSDLSTEPTGSNIHIPNPPLVEEHTKMAIDFGKLNNVLQNFVTATPDIQGAAIVTPDGLPLASSLPGSLNEERVAAMSAAMLSLGERIASELSRGSTDRIFLEGETGYAILTSCGDDAVFLVMASKAAKQGVLMLEIKQVVGQIKAALDRQLSAVA